MNRDSRKRDCLAQIVRKLGDGERITDAAYNALARLSARELSALDDWAYNVGLRRAARVVALGRIVTEMVQAQDGKPSTWHTGLPAEDAEREAGKIVKNALAQSKAASNG